MDPPTNLEVKERKADSITLTWRNPKQEYMCLIIEYRPKLETEWLSENMPRKTQESATLKGLKPNMGYAIRATVVGKLGCASSDAVTAVTAKAIIGPPTKVKVGKEEANSITLTWSNPQQCGDLTQYIIEYKEDNISDWQKNETKSEMYTFTLKNLKSNTKYIIRMRTEAGKERSDPGEEIMTKTAKGTPDTKSFTLRPGTPPVYLLNMKETKGMFRKMVFGKESSTKPSNKTIMVVGATGSGKTTLINGMINYILGVDWEDNWRFKVIDEEFNKSQAQSQTSEVTAYQIHHTDEFQVPYSLTIIDTPGYGDTRGIKQDKVITEKIREFFTNKDGIDTIDAVCFVVQSALARLTHTQKYIFETILSVFGKNIASNILTLITFADGKKPPVLEAIKEAKIPCATRADDDGTIVPVYFKFNNSVLFDKDSGGSGDEEFANMFWNMGKLSMSKFFTHLTSMTAQSLILTKEVLVERKQLEATVEGMQPLIRKGLSTMDEIRTTQSALDNHVTQIKANKDFEYEVVVEKSERVDIKSGTFITNCHGCNFTCHYPCGIPNDENKAKCNAMKNGKCTVCPGKCEWTVHNNMTYRWEIKRVKEKRTYQNLKSNYEKAVGDKMNQQQIVAKLEEEHHQVQMKVIEMMQTVTKCLTRLKEIALRSDPLATTDYIDLLIRSEEQEAKAGFNERIRELHEVREGALIIQKVQKDIALNSKEESKLEKLRRIVKGTTFGFLKKFRT